ncbi:MAG: SusC/RagA family TonB-linked outer membrane protein [Bacteroidota bacterium]
MLKRYLIVGILLLIGYQGMSQQGEIYASSTKQRPPDPVTESYSLKEGLSQLEKQFEVSIAYKDEWVNSKVVQVSGDSFSTVEEALDVMLNDTNLYYEKAGKGFYVISMKKAEGKSSEAQSASLLKSPVLYPSFSASSSTFAAEDLQSIPLASDVRVLAINVSGTVTDENGAGFPGVNVLVKGTSTGTSTDVNGKYSLLVEDENTTLVFSFIGYATQEVSVGARTVVDVTLVPDVKALEEVVVTALGIERSTKGLGYATSKISSDELSINRTPNLMNSLSGKIAGVSISGLGTGPAGTSKIRIRGQTSINGQNNPLIVVNGVPVDNTNFGTNPVGSGTNSDGSLAVRGGGNTSDGGDSFASFNPDDVESMTVLKGAAASALYGSRANNGVIMITTKSKGTNKGLGVTYNMNFTDETPLDYTKYQYEYGQGEFGVRPTMPNPNTGQWSFGEKFQPGMTQVLFNGLGSNANIPYVPQRGIINQFYRHGQNLTNTISLSTNGEKGGMNLSISNSNSTGIVPNNSFDRKTINLGFAYDLSEKFSFRGNINYSNEYNKNPPNIANQDNSIPTAIMSMANSMPLDVLRDNRYNAQGNEFIYSRFQNRTNPYFVLSDQFQNIRRDRILGNLSVKYDIVKWLYVQARVGQDFWTRDQDYNNFPTGQASLAPAPAGFVNGMFTQEQRRFRETNVDFLIAGNKDFGDFGLNFNLGGNQMKRRSDLNSVQVTDFVVRGLYTVQNGRGKDPLYDLQEQGVNSLYGSAEVNYKKFLYLTGTVRNDWFSTLSPANQSILYPSVSGAYVFSESFANKPGWLSSGKLRAAYAEVGSDGSVGPYQNVLFYSANANQFGGNPVATAGTNIPNPNLKPMRTGETELGLELRMLDNRLGFDLAVYKKITTDQIVQAQVSDASGYLTTRINSGKSQNQGIEMMVNIVPVRTNNFQWDFTFTGAYNITKVLSLLTDTPGSNITVGTHVFNGSVQQIVGQEMGQIVGFGYRRDANGQQIFGSNGLPLPTLQQVAFGSALPKWVGGFTNSFNYKGISVSFLIDFKLGGKMLSGTNFNAYRHGLHQVTLQGRDDDTSGIVGGSIVGQGVNEAGGPNTARAKVEDYCRL